MVPVKAHVSVSPRAVDRTKKRLEEKGGATHPHRVSVGIHEADGAKGKLDYEGNETSTPLVTVASIHEFKDRSWLRTWFDQNRSRLIKEMVTAMRAEFRGDTDAVAKAGRLWATDLREWIELEDGGLKALKPSTVARKQSAGLDRSSTPLYATGELVAAIKSMMDGGET